MERPFFDLGVVQLEALFAEEQENIGGLKTLLNELKHRKTDRARQLLKRIEAHLNTFDQPAKTTPSRAESFPQNERPAVQRPASRESQKAAPQPTSYGEPQPDDRRMPNQFSGIAAPGVTGKPGVYQPPLKTDLVLDLPPDATRVQRYVRALDAMISEMRKEGSGSRRYELENGKLIDTQGGQPIYAFPFSGEAEIFEEAKIEIQVNARRSGGQIVSISEGTLTISLDDQFEPSIQRCILLIDNTALIEALKERLEQIGRSELQLSLPLADCVVSDKQTLSQVSPIEVPTQKEQKEQKELNESQSKTLRFMLGRSVSYLWGPPGTGKTETLAPVIQAAFDADKRILVCSNTNQAVDQLIYKLCKHLTTDHLALKDGKILRIGKIVLEKLHDEYKSHVTIDGIVKRFSQDLKLRQQKLEVQVARLDAKATTIDRVLQLFVQLAKEKEELASLRQRHVEQIGITKTALNARDQARTRLQEFEAEKGKYESAGTLRRTFMRAEEKIIADIQRAKSEVEHQESWARNAAFETKTLETKYNELRAEFERLANSLAGHDQEQLKGSRKELEEQRQPFVSELQDIARKLAELETSIMREARVIGMTVTKAYLQVRDIGRFDVVVIDEASMVLLPALYFAAALSTERVIISGDFRQLPPIVPSKQQAIHDIIGHDVFQSAGIETGKEPQCVMLNTQYRMTDKICRLISKGMYDGELITAENRTPPKGPRPPAPYDGPLTIVDTSRLWPFENKNAFRSRFNLLHALLIRNLVGHLAARGFVNDTKALGVCTPYAAQAKLLQKILEDKSLRAEYVSAATVHAYQGDEKRMMILEVPESIGASRGVGLFVQGVPPYDIGARLINVAVSRAQEHLVIFANLTYLDARLPSTALLRSILHSMQNHGQVVDGKDVLALRPIEQDLKDMLNVVQLDLDAEKLGLFHSGSFSDACLFDIKNAKKSVVIFSGFVTPERVSSYGDLFRAKIDEGVAIRCVTRPPRFNGSIPVELGKQALDALEGIGVIVDCRQKIHEKIVLVDNRIVWSGSLNPLSHTSRTDEFMTRAESEGYAEVVAAFVSKRTGVAPAKLVSEVARAENPRCPQCNARTYYAEGRYGPYFSCEDEEDCGWRVSVRDGWPGEGPTTGESPPAEAPSCPECGGPTKLRAGRYGSFYGCADYPECKGIVKIQQNNSRSKTRLTSSKSSTSKQVSIPI
jgi:ssDNA-binding Zn-finger/Zn-ribbon topoisomerase 1